MSVQFGDPSPARNSIHDTRAYKVRPGAPEAAWGLDDVDGLGHVLPLAAAGAHTIGEVQPVVLAA
jgi:hypothetical protein